MSSSGCNSSRIEKIDAKLVLFLVLTVVTVVLWRASEPTISTGSNRARNETESSVVEVLLGSAEADRYAVSAQRTPIVAISSSKPPQHLAVAPVATESNDSRETEKIFLEVENDFPGLTAVPRPLTKATRFLTTEQFFKKYGLTNLLMSAAAMMAYASLDDRVVVFPLSSPTDFEHLIDMRLTQQRLLVANVVMATRKEVEELRVAPKPFKVRRLGHSLGSRLTAGSVDAATAQSVLEKQLFVMNATRHIPYLAQRDFFLAFPFSTTSPLDLCFYLRRFVFAPTIRAKAKALLWKLRSERNMRSVAAVHLRIEHDAVVTLRKEIGGISPVELRRFMENDVIPAARQAGCDGIYVCAGRLKEKYLAVLRNLSMPAVTKADFPDLGIQLSGGAEDRVIVTSHHSAAVDLLVIQHAVVAVSSDISTFAVAALSKRCPSPSPSLGFGAAEMVQRFKNSTLLEKLHVSNVTGTLRGPIRPRRNFVPGILMYGFEQHRGGAFGFSPLQSYGCEAPIKSHCFYHGVHSRK